MPSTKVRNLKSAMVANVSFRIPFSLFSACRPIGSLSSGVDGLLIRHTRYLQLSLALLLAACGGGAPEDSARLDAAASKAALNAGTPELALRLADATLAQHPADVNALTSRGLALTDMGRLDEARDSLRKAVTGRAHDVAALLALGRVELPVDPAAAETDFQSVLRQDGQNAAALNDLGIARDLQGRHADAEASYRAALVAQPTMVAAEVNLALCLAMRGEGSEAVRLLRPLAESPDATQKIKENFAAVLAMGGERGQAERILAANLAANEVAPAVNALASARAGGPVGPISETVAPAAATTVTRAPVTVAGTTVPVAAVPVAAVPVAAVPVAAVPVAASVATAPAAVMSAPVTVAPAKAAPVILARAMPIMAESVAGAPLADAGVTAENHADAPAATDNQAVVQLAALPSEDAAHAAWDLLSRRMPDLLNGRQPLFSRVERDGQTFWRVRTAGFSDLADARGFCTRVRTTGGGCTPLISRSDAGGQNRAPQKPVPVVAGRTVPGVS
jgi:Flp pilus assembly protein TadD